MNIKDLPFGEMEAFNVVVEIPQGSQDKYEYDEKLDVIKLDRVLYSAQRYPTNYGFVPQTRALDGDHADVLLFSTNPLVAGCVAEARAIGFMEMIDGGEIDNKILAVPITDPRFKDILSLDDLPQHVLLEIKNFFENIKVLQNKVVEVKGFGDKARAIQELESTKKAYLTEHE
jgi:inorganic pyrophosphatase